MNRHLKYILLCFFLTNSSLYAQKAITLTNITDSHNVGDYLYYWEDKTGMLDIQEIMADSVQSKFQLYPQKQFNQGVSNSTFWLKFEVQVQTTEQENWLLYASYGFLDYLTLYWQDTQGNWQSMENGISMPFAQRPYLHRYFVFPMPLEINQKHTFYLKVKTSTPFQVPLTIQHETTFDEENTTVSMLYGVFWGILMLMIFMSLFNYVSLRQMEYLYYVLFIVGSMFFYLTLSGHFFQYVWIENPQLGKRVLGSSIGIWIVGAALFTNSFLRTAHFLPTMHKAMRVYLWIGVALLPLPFLLPYQLFITLIVLIGNLGNLAICVAGIICWYKGNQYARYFAIAWVFYFTGTTLLALSTMGLLPNNFLTAHLGEISAVFEIVMFSLALSHKYRITQKEITVERQQTQERLIQLQKNTNEYLEKKVNERTQLIQEKQHEIEVQNEELRQQQEELETNRNQLAEQNKVIEYKNAQLKTYNETLEKKVEDRTKQLKNSNIELINHNNQLEQFAFITAHNLRSPVAQLLGLVNIIEMEGVSAEEKKEILQRIKDSAFRLNTIIKDLNEILEIRKGTNQEIEEINLYHKLEEVKEILEEDIEESKAVLEIDFEAIHTLMGVNAYIKSILYNLLSNAIKYRHPERPLLIKIQTLLNRKEVCLRVTDNGLGIDLEQSKGKIFGLYQRFHLHKEGKGLGLFLIKTQVEALGGRIEVESTLGEGTTFSLSFKK